MSALISIVGMVTLIALAFLLSEHKTKLNYRTIGFAFLLQFLIGGFVLYVPVGVRILKSVSDFISSILEYGNQGIAFMFGDMSNISLGFIFAFQVLPVVIFFSSLVAVAYHIGLMGWIIRIIGGGLQLLLKTSRAESLAATANIFVSQTEAPVVVRPYLKTMTRSELFAVMVGGMATVAGSVLAGYVGIGVELEYLIAASFMAAPGGFLIAKIIVPETANIDEEDAAHKDLREHYVNVFDAAASGASNGLKVAVNIGAMLLAFIGLIALVNGTLQWVGNIVGYDNLSIQLLLGYAFQPLAFLLGVPWAETHVTGSVIGQKLVLNEFVAFIDFAKYKETLSAETQAITTIALCGFANFGSFAVLLGGISTLAPSRREDVANLGLKAVFAGFIANMMSAAIAGFYLGIMH